MQASSPADSRGRRQLINAASLEKLLVALGPGSAHRPRRKTGTRNSSQLPARHRASWISACRSWMATKWLDSAGPIRGWRKITLVAMTGYGKEEDRQAIAGRRIQRPPGQAGQSRGSPAPAAAHHGKSRESIAGVIRGLACCFARLLRLPGRRCNPDAPRDRQVHSQVAQITEPRTEHLAALTAEDVVAQPAAAIRAFLVLYPGCDVHRRPLSCSRSYELGRGSSN